MERGVNLLALAETYINEIRPTGLVVSPDVIVAQAIRATKYYEGFAELDLLDSHAEVSEETEITKSERAIITPLFELYVERENALILEATRSLGVEVYGRSLSEISQDITQKELEIQNLSFDFEIFTI